MNDTVIHVEGLGKRYRLHHQTEERYVSLRDVVAAKAKTIGRRLVGAAIRPPLETEEFWALHDVSFEVKRGEVLGIIGRNGAGKSTLLKILSRITEPTEGRARICGRVASLLEVGTGFHPELTGRENIYLNGAILGMSRTEIEYKFDAIVDFADIERFLDTPVKHYSSGMYLRLAFSVAAHLEPEILLVDEVLAVGDIGFQKKCIGKIQEVSQREGRTVLFVSHQLPAIRELCSSAMILSAGSVAEHGRASAIVSHYERSARTSATWSTLPVPAELLESAYIVSAVVERAGGSPATVLSVGEIWSVRLRFRVARQMSAFVASVGFITAAGMPVQTVWTSPARLPPGEFEASFLQDKVIIGAGSYDVIAGLSENECAIQQMNCGRIDISGEGAIGYFQVTSGVGAVLNSMAVTVRRIA